MTRTVVDHALRADSLEGARNSTLQGCYIIRVLPKSYTHPKGKRLERHQQGLWCSSVIGHLPSMCKALSLIPSKAIKGTSDAVGDKAG
jgi:hypothetical protein